MHLLGLGDGGARLEALAADLTRNTLAVGGLDADGRWALVDEKSYKSPVPNVYVIGDSIKSANQPKAGHIGNQQAKVCADAILRACA